MCSEIAYSPLGCKPGHRSWAMTGEVTWHTCFWWWWKTGAPRQNPRKNTGRTCQLYTETLTGLFVWGESADYWAAVLPRLKVNICSGTQRSIPIIYLSNIAIPHYKNIPLHAMSAVLQYMYFSYFTPLISCLLWCGISNILYSTSLGISID